MQPLLRRRLYLGAVFAAIVASSFFFVRPEISSEALVACLPASQDAVVYLDVARLRRVGIVNQLAGGAGVQEADYLKFVEETGFDYRRDLDAVAASLHSDGAHIVIKGRYDLQRLQAYARSHGGQCAGEFCSMAGSTSAIKISFRPLERAWGDPWFGQRPLAVASGADPMAAAAMRRGGSIPQFRPPAAAAWIYLPAAALQARADLPAVVNGLFEALRGAGSATLEMQPGERGIQVELTASCANAEQANGIAARLQRSTEAVRQARAEEAGKPGVNELAELLAGGSFRVDQTLVRGLWPVPKGMLEALSK